MATWIFVMDIARLVGNLALEGVAAECSGSEGNSKSGDRVPASPKEEDIFSEYC